MHLINMYKCLLVVFIFLFLHETLGEEETMIGKIIKNCKLDKNLKKSELEDFQNQTDFSKCKNWTSVNSIISQKKLDGEKINYIRCLLYFETFVSFCNHLSPVLKNYDMIFEETLPRNIDVKGICEGLSSRPKIDDHTASVWKFIQNTTLCQYICTDIKGEDIILNSLCAKSYYFNNLKLDSSKTTSIKPTELKKGDELQVSNKSSIQNNTKSTTTNNTSNSRAEVIHSEQKPSLSSEKIEEVQRKPQIGEQYTAVKDNMLETNTGDSSNYLLVKDSKNVETTMDYPDEQKTMQIHNTYATSDKKQYNVDSTYKTKEQVITIPQEVEVKSQHEEIISNSFESVKNDQISETYNYDGDMEGNSYFFTYFTFICVAFIVGYVGYHNKQKILALILEGRQTRRSQRDMRPNSANYHKLDSTLEEAISSSCNKNSSYVIY